ncbi:SWIM zinc finger-containing protein [Halovivax ruber XH-70]|uniref:SWIM zinc finger-containing protein n=1 Tax=Halovivax ruber (strain DSM 18193 / JCM 13892 / XH-70) TaxID=797302 RepID=L0I9J5_HALRX|nr:SWIM zinc finger family protein [Halovivax ruber]AGB14901.1 SWIM zinc finger-containing protein [Halovivax ruber XH-70]
MNTIASPKTPLSVPHPDQLDERSRRARTEPMSVLALGDGLYEVETEETTYLVDVAAGRCSCPDHIFRGARCKHVRRVAIEITEGLAPPPGKLAVECADCAERVFVDEDDGGPVYCDRHTLSPGDLARDRETDARVTVVAVSDRRADATAVPATGEPVADYGTNSGYDGDVPVVAAVYPHATVQRNGPVPRDLQIYLFPRTRLTRVE